MDAGIIIAIITAGCALLGSSHRQRQSEQDSSLQDRPAGTQSRQAQQPCGANVSCRGRDSTEPQRHKRSSTPDNRTGKQMTAIPLTAAADGGYIL